MAHTTRSILAKIKCQHLNLYRGEGYWYFIYDNGSGVYESHSVYVMRLNDMPEARWVGIGSAFVEATEAEARDRPTHTTFNRVFRV